MVFKAAKEEYINLLTNIRDYFKESDNSIHKARNEIKILDYENRKLVVKAFKIPHFINKIVYNFFRDSKAKRSYENSVKLVNLGINTPTPIGYIEFNSFLFFKDSYYVCEYYNYDFEIRAVFKDDTFENKEEIIKQFIEFTFDLHNKGVYHIDYSPGNILVKKVEDKYEFYIVDVNRMKFLDFDLDLRMKSMMKLTSNREYNKMIMSYYAKVSGLALDDVTSKFTHYLREQEKYLENKKKIKSYRF